MIFLVQAPRTLTTLGCDPRLTIIFSSDIKAFKANMLASARTCSSFRWNHREAFTQYLFFFKFSFQEDSTSTSCSWANRQPSRVLDCKMVKRGNDHFHSDSGEGLAVADAEGAALDDASEGAGAQLPTQVQPFARYLPSRLTKLQKRKPGKNLKPTNGTSFQPNFTCDRKATGRPARPSVDPDWNSPDCPDRIDPAGAIERQPYVSTRKHERKRNLFKSYSYVIQYYSVKRSYRPRSSSSTIILGDLDFSFVLYYLCH